MTLPKFEVMHLLPLNLTSKTTNYTNYANPYPLFATFV